MSTYTAKFVRDSASTLTPANVRNMTGADTSQWDRNGYMAVVDTHSSIYGSHSATVKVYHPSKIGPGAVEYVTASDPETRDRRIVESLSRLVPMVERWNGGEWLVESVEWVGDGAHDVTVRTASGQIATDENSIRRARRQALRCDPMGKSKRSNLLSHDGYSMTFRIYR